MDTSVINKWMKLSDINIIKLIPPKSMNYNYGGYFWNYKKEFTKHYIEYIFPYLLQKSKDLNISIKTLTIFDLGCGWGPLAIATLLYLRNIPDQDIDAQLNYLGVDIRKDAIDWLSESYSEFKNIGFMLHKADSNIDYVGAVQNNSSTLGKSSGKEGQYELPLGFKHNWQWSSSVFTHLTPEASRQALNSIRQTCAKNSMQVNSWLIIDDESRFSLAAGTADRILPYDFGEYLSYSETNPLICTCYKIDAIKKMYAEAGLEIVSIEKGSWRGEFYKNDMDFYQDLIISRPLV